MFIEPNSSNSQAGYSLFFIVLISASIPCITRCEKDRHGYKYNTNV
jgi:hypothetical protein